MLAMVYKMCPIGRTYKVYINSTTVSHDWGRLKRHTVRRMDFFAKNSLAPSAKEARKSYAVWLLAVGHATRRSSVGRRPVWRRKAAAKRLGSS